MSGEHLKKRIVNFLDRRYMKKLKSIAIAATLFGSCIGAVKAQTFPISLGGTQNANSCQTVLVLTDSEANDGAYLPNESHEITVCFITLDDNPLQFAILPTNSALTSIWDVDSNSELYVYEGNSTAAPLIGVFNSATDPSGVFFTTTSSCLTFVFLSGPESSGQGFRARITCVQEQQPFTANVIIAPPQELLEEEIPGLEGKNVITHCFLDTLKFTAVPNFPLSNATGNGYEQLAEECNYIWDMGDGTVAEGINLTSFTHVYQNPGGHFARLSIIDINGRMERYEAYLLAAPRPIFSNIVFGDTLCIADSTRITGGILALDTVGVGPATSAVNLNFNFTDSIALPDVPQGQVTSYFSQIDIFGYSNNPIIESTDDFLEVCTNMEHSFLGDLEIVLICPTGQEVILKEFPGSGTTYLGAPIDTPGSNGIPGVGADYCFSPTAVWGTMLDEDEQDNYVIAGTPPGNSMSPGTYSAFDSFDNLIGCPVNGLWRLKFTDHLPQDDGFLFSWALNFNPLFTIDTIYYTPQIVNAYWLDNIDIVENNDTIVTVLPSAQGNNFFTFVAEDSFGCLHDTTFNVYVRPLVVASNSLACDLTHGLVMQNAQGGGTWEFVTGPTANSSATFEGQPFGFADVEVNDHGIYQFLFTDANCGYTDIAQIDFRPDPQIQPFVTDTVLCNNANIVFDAGPQFPNSQNFQIQWTYNGEVINTTDYSIVADQTGIYQLALTGHCGSAVDQSDVVAIQLTIEGDTICGLQYPALEVTIDPPGNGTWSSPTENLSFSNPTGQITSVTSTLYGRYEVIFTDSRCPDDEERGAVRFVEQPVVSVTPQNPAFCVDIDSLQLRATVQGDFTGDYIWSVNNDPQAVTVGTIVFEKETFEALETHLVEARVVDNFGVCPVGEGSVTFVGKHCSYIIPNVVTPNGDGRNDTWDIVDLDKFPEARLKVFNRWGKLVFEQDNVDQYQKQRNGRGWDPEDLSEGVYFYELILPSVQKVETGNLTLLRQGQQRR